MQTMRMDILAGDALEARIKELEEERYAIIYNCGHVKLTRRV